MNLTEQLAATAIAALSAVTVPTVCINPDLRDGTKSISFSIDAAYSGKIDLEIQTSPEEKLIFWIDGQETTEAKWFKALEAE